MENNIPDIIVGRLPIYLQALEHLQAQGILTTSSQELGEIIGISAAQIRKDLSQFGEFGKQGKGYAISFLVEQLREILNVNHLWDMVVIGAGNLGRAIANYQSFRNHGFQVSMIFDIDPVRIGTVIEGYTVQDMAKLVPLIQRAGIKIAMLTVPSAAAQAVANDLITAGIKAILNYAPITLYAPSDVHIQYVDPVIYLQKMTYYLK